MRLFFCFTLTLIASLYAQTSSAQEAPLCQSDQALQEARFEVHATAEFEALAKSAIEVFLLSRDKFVYDTEGQIMYRGTSRQQRYFLKLISFDDVTTPQSDKFGDVVFLIALDLAQNEGIGNLQTAESNPFDNPSVVSRLVEVRWWEENDRHVVYNKNMIECAVNTVPMAENALY